MATYIYETIPKKPGGKVCRFEIKQSMKDTALTKHPETGEPVRRVITGGLGFLNPTLHTKPGKSYYPKSHSSGCGCCH
jgi:hypothetical protein